MKAHSTATARRLAQWIADRYADPLADSYEAQRVLDVLTADVLNHGAVGCLLITRAACRD